MTRALLLASAALAASMLAGGAANAQVAFDWSGFYAGLHGGYLAGNVHITEGPVVTTGSLSGFVGGVLMGYNTAMKGSMPGIVGVEMDVGFGDLTGTGVSCMDCAVELLTYDFDWDAHFRARAGFPMGSVMLFIAGGLALAELSVTESVPFGGLYVGGTIGAGLDFGLAPNLTGRIEGLYDFYAPKDYDEYRVRFAAWTARAALIMRLP